MKRIIKIFTSQILIVLSLFLFSSCGVWRDFTGYFNGYYNAENLFEESESLLKKEKKELFSLQEPNPAGNTSQNLTKVIQKLSKLLQFNSQSNLMDDALIMIGKSFYYQKNYQKAIRKFNELITSDPTSGLILESKLWIAKSHFRLGEYETGLEKLAEVYSIAEKEDENSILISAYIEEISYLITKEKLAEAISKCNKLIEVSDDDVISALTMYELGILYRDNDQFESSAKAFADVNNYSPDYQTEYNAKLEYGKIQRELGQYQKSLDIFKDIRRESNYNDYLDKTDLEIGLSLIKLEKTEEAFEKLKLVDTAYVQTPSSGIASYNLGELAEYKLMDFDSAKYFYKKAASSLAPIEIKERADKKVQVLNKLENLNKTIFTLSKKLLYLTDSTAFIADSIAYMKEQARIDSLNAETESLQSGSDEQRNNNSQGKRRGNRGNSGNTANTGNAATTGNTANTGNRDNTDNQSVTDQGNMSQKYTIKLVKPIRPTISSDSLKFSIAKYEYELGGLFFTEMNLLDSAYNCYMNIIREYPNSPFVSRTLFALGTYYLTVEEKSKADSLFNIIYEKYKNESIVNAAAEKLEKPFVNLNYDPAESLYVAAETKFQNKNYNEAVSDFYNISEKYSSSVYAPKALYTTGWLLENELHMIDSAAVIYDTLISRYSKTSFANAVRTKLNNYKLEKNRIQASKDSINAASDSLANTGQKDGIVKGTTGISEKNDKVLLNDEKQKQDTSGTVLNADSTGFINRNRKVVEDSLKNKVQVSRRDTTISNSKLKK